MQVHTATLKSLVQGEKQFQVPIWQRQYTWKASQHTQLWSDLAEQYRHLRSGNPPASGHFLGSFVLSPKDPMAAGVSYFLIIDGQQRLTTLMLLLCALRDRAAETDPLALERYDEVYLINKFHEGEARMRLLPTEEDRASFRRWLAREPDNGAGDEISRAYRFYAARLAEPIDAIYVERTFNAGQYLQSIDRIHRLGLARGTETRITFLVSEGTIDETVDDRVRVKAERLAAIYKAGAGDEHLRRGSA